MIINSPGRKGITAKLAFIVTSPSPNMSLRSNGERMEVTGGDGNDVRRETGYRSRLVSVGSHTNDG